MKSKELYIKYLQQARTEHVRWVNNIKLLVSGLNIEERSIPLNPAEAPFGKWYYEKAMLFSLTNAQTALVDIEKLFLSIHDVYMKIYSIYYGKNKSSIMGSIFGRNTGVSAHEAVLAEKYYEDIVSISDNLKNKINLFEKILHATSDERFEEIMPFENTETLSLQTDTIQSKLKDDGAYHYGARCRS